MIVENSRRSQVFGNNGRIPLLLRSSKTMRGQWMDESKRRGISSGTERKLVRAKNQSISLRTLIFPRFPKWVT